MLKKIKKIISRIIFFNPYLRKIRIWLGIKFNHFPACKFFQESTNVLHVGGNTGQERYIYEYFDLNVAFIEPIPIVFDQLQHNIQKFKKVKAFNKLFWNTTGQSLELNVANNNGYSSSIFELADHRVLWPDVKYVNKLNLITSSADDFINSKEWGFIPDTIVMDTQGAELEILKGCVKLLQYVKFIKIELPDFNAYENGCTLTEVETYLQDFGYSVMQKVLIKEVPDFSGKYFEVVFVNKTK
jgi:FkbM family methyltransferase